MNIKLTEYIRTTTLTLNIKDAPMTALPLIKDAFAKLATDLDEALGAYYRQDVDKVAAFLAKVEARDVMQPVIVTDISPGEAQRTLDALKSYKEDNAAREAMQAKRRGRPPKVKVEEPAPVNDDTAALQKVVDEPTPNPLGFGTTPLEAAIAAAEGRNSRGEGGHLTAPTTEASSTPTDGATIATASSEPVSDSDLQKYCVKLAQHYGGPQKVFDLAKQFVEEGAVPRPSNIKGDDKRRAFIKAVEEDSGVKYVG